MNKSLLGGLIIGVAVAAGGGAIASFTLHRQPDYAKVIEVTPLTKTISTPRQSCHDETVTHQKQPSDSHQVIGTVAGAVLGGVIGHQIGGGSPKTIPTPPPAPPRLTTAHTPHTHTTTKHTHH